MPPDSLECNLGYKHFQYYHMIFAIEHLNGEVDQVDRVRGENSWGF